VAEDPDILLSRVGVRIVQRRQELGLMQKDLAARLEMAQTYLAQIEHGRQNLTIRTLAKIANALDTTVVALLA
jgi:transcriptional regulator with XRE-family HTH domain